MSKPLHLSVLQQRFLVHCFSNELPKSTSSAKKEDMFTDQTGRKKRGGIVLFNRKCHQMSLQGQDDTFSVVHRLIYLNKCFQSQNPESFDQYSWSLVLIPVLPLLWWL